MSSKLVHSTDSRKPSIVAALKAKSGGTKVTLLEEGPAGTFSGDCLKRAGKGFEKLGRFTVVLEAPPAPARKSGPKPAVAIEDACAAEGCYKAPTRGGFCEDHGSDTKTIKELKGSKKPKADPKVKAELAKLVEASVSPAKAPKGKRATKEAKTSPEVSVDVPGTIQTLRAKGWSDASIGKALGVTGQTVWCWRKRGSPCPYQPELLSLVAAEPPRKDISRPEAIATGKLQTKKAAAAKASHVSKATDPRQLVLNLRDYLDEVLVQLKAGKK